MADLTNGLPNGSDAQRRLKRAKRRMNAVFATIIVFAVAAVMFSIALLLPYHPLKVHDYIPDQAVVCPQGIVVVIVDYEIERSAVGERIRQVESQPTWIVEDVPGLRKGETLTLNETDWADELLEPGRRTTPSTVLRLAPETPGIWRPGVELTVRGRGQLGLPAVQELERAAHQTVRVLDGDDPKCTSESGRT